MSATVTLKNSYLEVSFHPASGLPVSYRHRASGSFFSGSAQAPIARVCRLSPRRYADVPAVPISSHAGRSVVEFHYSILMEETSAVSFSLRFFLDRGHLLFTLENVSETEGFELIEVRVPDLISLCGGKGNWFTHCQNFGSLVRLEEAVPGALPEHPYFGAISAKLPVIMLGQKTGICVLETTAFQDGMTLRVEKSGSEKTVFLGTVKAYRVDGSGWCNTNDDHLTRCYGNANTPNLLVGQKSSCRLDFIGDYDDDGTVDWVDGVKLVRDRMPVLRTDYYDDKFLYVLPCDHPMLETPKNTFAQAGDYIRKLSNLTDAWPQACFILGWQNEGMDTKYPHVKTINARLGGYDAYLRLKALGETYNCNVGLHDNFDDAYENSPAWEEKNIARLPDGRLWKSRNWTRDVSYVQGLAKYMKRGGVERIDYTCDRYRLHETAHVDVLSWFAIRNDWDPAHPASGIQNLYEGRYRVLDEFAKRGVDVSSEALRYPMVGRMNLCFQEEEAFGECPFGGHPVPIIPCIYKNAILHGGGVWNDWSRPYGLWLINNIHKLLWFGWDHPVAEDLSVLTELFYLLHHPWFKIHRLPMTGYTISEDGTEMLRMEKNSSIVYTPATGAYSVCFCGEEISRNGQLFCEIDPMRLAFYSLTADTLRCRIPADWGSENSLHAYSLTENGRIPASVRIDNGYAVVETVPRIPVIVSRETI